MGKGTRVQMLAALAMLAGVCTGLLDVEWQRVACLFAGMLIARWAGWVADK